MQRHRVGRIALARPSDASEVAALMASRGPAPSGIRAGGAQHRVPPGGRLVGAIAEAA